MKISIDSILTKLSDLSQRALTPEISRSTGRNTEPGDVEITKIYIGAAGKPENRIDISNQVKTIEIFESIFMPVVCAEIGLADPVGLVDRYNIQAGDIVTFGLRTPGSDNFQEWEFAVREVGSKQFNANLKTQTYTLPLVSVEALRNSVVVVDFKAKDNINNIVKRVFDRYIKTRKRVEVDPTKSIEDLPPLTSNPPFRIISYLLGYAYSTKYKSNAYVFFENKDGYHFTAVEKLIEQGTRKYTSGNKNDMEFFYDASTKDSFQDVTIRNILAFNMLASNQFSNASKITNKVNTYDLARGNYKSFFYTSGDESFVIGANTSPIAQSLTFESTYKQTTREIEFIPFSSDATSASIAENKAKRKAFAQMLEQQTINILVYGDTEITVGQVIKCNLPASVTFEDLQGNSEIYSGLYLVTKVRHMIVNSDKPQHNISLELKQCGLNV